MTFLVDTNVLSGLARAKPSDRVVKSARENQSQLYVTTITLSELKYGAAILRDWLSRLNEIMAGRIVSFNRAVSYVWADMGAKLKRDRHTLPIADGMIAATARRHDLTVATRDTDDFAVTGLSVINPFDEQTT